MKTATITATNYYYIANAIQEKIAETKFDMQENERLVRESGYNMECCISFQRTQIYQLENFLKEIEK